MSSARSAPHATHSIAGHRRLTVTLTRRRLGDLVARGALDLVGKITEGWATSDLLTRSRENYRNYPNR